MPVRITRVLLIVNPASRRGSRRADDVTKAFDKAGVFLDSMVTRAPGHGAELAARHAASYDAIFTLGGDGTAMEVVGALAHTGPPVGILPGGTGNVIAKTLGTPSNVGRAVNALLAGEEARIDLGRLQNGQRFAIGMGVGLDATMIAHAPVALKRRLGFAAYVVGAFRAFITLEKFTVRLTVDGQLVEMRASAVLIANFGAVMNNLLAFGDGIQRDDGMLNACVFSPRNSKDALRILWKMARKDFSPDPCIYYRAGSAFRVETIPPRLGQADGELVGNSPFEVVVEPLAGRVLVPRR
ncbi:MAG TPA: YegS/Rv2252/BmrU family lipid kinase [Gemmatimonadaceae bacterium]|nr:YegS/Rv2252/BmrU family lipid kinase [Gemmatimonadaceae bacterium]